MYRKLTDADVDLLKEEITKDPVHSKDPTFNAGIFVDPDGQSIVFEDNEGPVMFVNMRREIRLTIQFRESVSKERLRECFKKYIPIFAAASKKAGFSAFTYTTENKALAWFLRSFGFRKEETQRKVL